MPLQLDNRQRAMLQEMGVHVWLPSATEVATVAQPPVVAVATPRAPQAAPAVAAPPAAAAPIAAPVSALAPASTPLPDAGTLDWATLKQTVDNCQACGLCKVRSNTTLRVPTVGLCDWMVVGDAPDEDEDRAGAPFAAPDGVLLDNMLRAVGLQRANPVSPTGNAQAAAPATGSASQRAYVTNVVKCRAAHGAVVQPAELASCAAYLQREIALVQPKMILAMGRFANQLLLSETPAAATLPLGKLRGTVHRYQGVPVVVSYHPKTLMRNGADKAKAWADLCLAAETLTNRTD